MPFIYQTATFRENMKVLRQISFETKKSKMLCALQAGS